jgi:hypothetical protein
MNDSVSDPSKFVFYIMHCTRRGRSVYLNVLQGLFKDGGMKLTFVSMHIARYLVQAWDVRNTCKHSGAVLPLPSAPVGRGVDGIDAMA